MRKTILIIVVLALAWIGFAAWPLYDLLQLTRAVERGDVAEVARRVDFARVRTALTQQLTEAYLQRSGARPGPLVPAVASIADPIMAKFISVEALADLLRAGWPRTVLPDRPPGAVGISVAALGNAWDLFAASDYGIIRYEVTVPVSAPPDRGFRLQLRLANWRWRLTAVRLPEPVRMLLADEIIKSTRPRSP